MVAYSFNKRFVAAIVSGRKCQTVRAPRKRHVRPDEDLQLYTGMRTKSCRLIGRAICADVMPIAIYFSGGEIRAGTRMDLIAWSVADLNRFAERDGFQNWAALRGFWEEAHPEADEVFNGWLIQWRDFAPSAEIA